MPLLLVVVAYTHPWKTHMYCSHTCCDAYTALALTICVIYVGQDGSSSALKARRHIVLNRLCHVSYKSGTVNSKSFVGKILPGLSGNWN